MKDNLIEDWLAAREIIAAALQQWFPRLTSADALVYSDAIQARLAAKRLLVVESSKIKDDTA